MKIVSKKGIFKKYFTLKKEEKLTPKIVNVFSKNIYKNGKLTNFDLSSKFFLILSVQTKKTFLLF